MSYNFQQRMSRLPQRWRTQRNAIRNANCKTSWIIKILNAHCASGICPVAYLSECLWTLLSINDTITVVWDDSWIMGCDTARIFWKYLSWNVSLYPHIVEERDWTKLVDHVASGLLLLSGNTFVFKSENEDKKHWCSSSCLQSDLRLSKITRRI